MPDITPTPHQEKALDWLTAHVVDGAPLVAIRGLAGTGKTSLVPLLRQRLAAHHIKTVVGSPTHRAAMILRRKGLSDATTVHELALTPYFTPEYARAMAWLGDIIPCRLGKEPHADVDDLPWLLHEHGKADLAKMRDLRRHRGHVPAKKLLASVGLHGKDFFDGFGPKVGEGVLIVDEASMVGQAMLQLCQQAYRQIVLVGDPGQLPPVKDPAVLAKVEGTDLTEIHRQAADSPIIQLAYRARQGETFWQGPLRHFSPITTSDVARVELADAAALLESPLIVWRNSTRISCTHAIRQALGYTKEHLTVGEPLVCRSTSQDDRAMGFYNNGLYRIVEVNPDTPRIVTVEDAQGETQEITLHLEELDGEGIPYNAIPFRFGYTLTAHTAQGGEWSTVYVSLPDLVHYAGMCQRYGRQEELAQWAYTAITRAKDQLCFLTQHHFERIPDMATPKKEPTMAPPSALMLMPEGSQAHAEAAAGFDSLVQGLGPADDILDPPVPPEATQETPQDAPGSTQAPPTTLEPSQTPKGPTAPIAPQALGFLQWLQGEIHKCLAEEKTGLDRHLDYMTDFLKNWWATQTASNEHAVYQFGAALERLQQGGLNTAPPYLVKVEAVSPQGYPVQFAVTKPSMVAPAPESGLLDVLPMLLNWLAENGYMPPASVAPVEEGYGQ